MAWSFGDGWDCYAAIADMANGYWDSVNASTASFIAGRFTGSQAVHFNGGSFSVTKSSATNDAIHHLIVSFRQTSAISGTSLSAYLQLLDGVTNQCAVVFRSDGAILLASGGPTGTVLATYTGAFPVTNTWYAFEIEVVINNTTGSFTVRKNGNTSNDFTLGSLNTRGGTANNYANKLTFGTQSTGVAQDTDDLYWRSDASSVPWMGDIRCYTRMPASDQSVQFSRTPTNYFVQSTAAVTTNSLSANNIRATSVVASTTGILASLTFNFNAGMTGHAKMALYDNTGTSGGPGALLGQSTELTNPGAGVNTFSVTGGPTVQRGVTYWIALWSDAAAPGTGGNLMPNDVLALTYTTAFPATMTGFSATSTSGIGSNGMNVTPFNAGVINEPQQDATTSYVFDSTPGDADFYGIAAIASTPVATIAVTTRGYMQKSDAGTRTAAVQLKSGSATVASSTLVLTTSGWQWAWRTDITDPNTSAAWTAAAVNNAQVGPKVIA